MPAIHTEAARGFQQGAGAYARGRPDYPAEADVWLTCDLGLAPGAAVVELGAGTGKFTTRLVATAADVIAVEPVAGMREHLAATAAQARIVEGTAQAIPLPDACADAVVCAQSFHWFAEPAALAEIARVLRPGGQLGLIWNIRDERVPWVAALHELARPFEGDTPRHGSGIWRTLFPGPDFGPLIDRYCDHGHSGPAEQVVLDRTLSTSFLAALPQAEREAVAQRIRELIATTPALQGPVVTFPYRTAMHRSLRHG